MDVEVFKAGYLAGPLAEVGATVAVGGALGYITDTLGDLAIGADEVVTEQAATEMIPHHAGMPIVMPQLSDTMTEGIVVTWEKAIGDKIKRGDIVATVETDKAIMDVEVFHEGFLSGPLAGVGSTVEVAHPMAFIVSDAATGERYRSHHFRRTQGDRKPITRRTRPAASRRGGQIHACSHSRSDPTRAKPVARPAGRQASPYARKIAGAMGVDLSQLAGSRPGRRDRRRRTWRVHARAWREVAHSLPQVEVPGTGRAMTSMEKAVSHSMTAALTLPTFDVTFNIKPEKLIAAAKARKISVTVAIAKACSVAMLKHPMLNNCYQPVDKIVERSQPRFRHCRRR